MQPWSRAFRCLFFMVQFPMKKSKSLLEDSGEAVMIRSPFGANFRGGKGKLSIWAEAVEKIARNRRVAEMWGAETKGAGRREAGKGWWSMLVNL